MLHTGKRSGESAVSTVMPFESLRVLNNTDANAPYLYPKTLPVRSKGSLTPQARPPATRSLFETERHRVADFDCARPDMRGRRVRTAAIKPLA